jgi:hypothetical protein
MEKTDFIHQSVLGILIPETPYDVVSEVFASAHVQEHPLFEDSKVASYITQRRILHFGQFVTCKMRFINLTHHQVTAR